MELLYKAPSCCTNDHLPDTREVMELGFSDTLRSLFERITKAVFKGELKAGDIDEDWVRHTSKELTDAVETGYDVPDQKMLAFLKENVAIFSVAKTHKELRELTDLLTDGERVLPFGEFRDKANKLYATSEDRLRSEYNHALASAQMASKWSRIQEDKDALPMLVYRTIGDTHVRQEHAALDGIQRPVDDEFWDTYYPPNAWGCRCDVDQVATGKATNLENKNLPKNPTIFRNNVGKTGIVFPDSHPYFEGFKPDKARKALNKLEFEALGDEYHKSNKAASDRFKGLDKFPDALGYDKDSGGYIALHDKHESGVMPVELPTCTLLKKQGYGVQLVKEINVPKPVYDALIGGNRYDIKYISKAKNIYRAVTEAISTDDGLKTRFIIHIVNDIPDMATMLRNVRGRAKIAPTLDEVWFIYKKKLVKASRQELIDMAYILQ